MEDGLDIAQFRKYLQEMQTAFKQEMHEDDEFQPEMEDLVAAIGRLEQELAHQKSQQIIADFYTVYSFIQAFNDESEDEEDLEFEDDEGSSF